MDFVGDYQKQQRLAKALRDREKALLSNQIDMGPIVTQGNDTFPGQVQANWAAPLALLGQAYFAKQAGDKAATAEDEAVQARRQGLYGILGMQDPSMRGPAPVVPQGGDVGPVQQGAAPMTPAGQPGAQMPAGTLPEDFEMTPDKMLALSELGVDPSMIQMMKPEKEKIANFLQAIPNMSPELAMDMAKRMKIDPEVARNAVLDYRAQQAKELEAKTQAQIKAAIAGRTPREPREPRQIDPIKALQREIIVRRMQGDNAKADELTGILQGVQQAASKTGGKGGAGGAGSSKKLTLTDDEVENRLQEMESIVNAPNADVTFGKRGRAEREFADKASASDNPLVAALGVSVDPEGGPEAARFDAAVSDFGLEKIGYLYPASDTDVAWIMKNLASSRKNLSTAKEMTQRMRRVYSKAKTGGFVDEKGNKLDYTPPAEGGFRVGTEAEDAGGGDEEDLSWMTPEQRKRYRELGNQ